MVLTARITAGVLLAAMAASTTAKGHSGCPGSKCGPPPNGPNGTCRPYPTKYLNCHGACFDFAGVWMDGTQPVNVTQDWSFIPAFPREYYPARAGMGEKPGDREVDGCAGSFTPAAGAAVTFKAATVPCVTVEGWAHPQNGSVDNRFPEPGCSVLNAALTTSGGLTAKIVRAADSTTLAWSNGRNWTKPCADFSGYWCTGVKAAGEYCKYFWNQVGCITEGFAKGYSGPQAGNKPGNRIDTDYHGLKAVFELADSKTPGLDRLIWQNVHGPGDNVTWYRYVNGSH